MSSEDYRRFAMQQLIEQKRLVDGLGLKFD